jgi:chaperonin GroEL
VPLLRAAKALEGMKGDNDDQRTGVDIVMRRAIRWPARLIVENAGLDGSVVLGKLIEHKDYAFGYDAQKEEYGDLYKLGIIGPTKVVRTALQHAASIAGLLITTEAMVAEKPKKETPAPATPGGGMDY